MPSNRTPEATFRIGYCSASVFVNESTGEGGSREFRSVSVQRSYRDGDTTKYVASFGLADLPAAIRAVQLEQQHVEQVEAKVSG